MPVVRMRSLQKLYFTRSVFQVAWGAAVIGTAPLDPPLAAGLLVVYPLWDVACTTYDLRSDGLADDARKSQSINAVLGILAAIGIAFGLFEQPTVSIAIFGAWALAAGVLQLIAALIRRRQIGGQWAMILSGAQSSLVGIAFLLGGLAGKVHVKDMGGYAIFGAIYFLIAAVLLGRRLARTPAAANV